MNNQYNIEYINAFRLFLIDEKAKYMENEVQNKDKLTSALDNGIELDLSKIIRSNEGSYSKDDIEQFNNELMGDFDLSDSLVEKAKTSLHIELDKKELKKTLNMHQKPGFLSVKNEEKNTKRKPKSAMKLQYEAEAGAIKKRLGSISVIRKNLGLNQRKAAQLLLVDPSALNRWEKTGNDAPFYIYKALEWYSLLVDKHPNMGNSFWLQQDKLELNEKLISNLKSDLLNELKNEELSFSSGSLTFNKDNSLKRLISVSLLSLCIGVLLGFVLVS